MTEREAVIIMALVICYLIGKLYRLENKLNRLNIFLVEMCKGLEKTGVVKVEER